MENKNFWGNGKVNTGSIIIGAIALIIILVVMLSLARLTYRLLTLAAIPLLIVTAIIDHKIIVNYFQWVVSIVKKNTLMGIGLSLMSIVFYPLVAAVLFGRAFFTWRLKKAVKNHEESMPPEQAQIGEYIEYEEIRKPKERIKQERSASKENDYDSFFKE